MFTPLFISKLGGIIKLVLIQTRLTIKKILMFIQEYVAKFAERFSKLKGGQKYCCNSDLSSQQKDVQKTFLLRLCSSVGNYGLPQHSISNVCQFYKTWIRQKTTLCIHKFQSLKKLRTLRIINHRMH